MKNILILTAGLLVAGVSITANALPPKPTTCPSAQSLKQIALIVKKDDDKINKNSYSAGQVGKFGTSTQWMLGINCIIAANQAKANNIARDIVSHLTLTTTKPFDGSTIGDAGSWGCLYSSSSNYVFPKNCFNSIYTVSPVPR